MPYKSGVTGNAIKLDRRKEALNYNHSAYVRLMQPGDVFYLVGQKEFGCEQVKSVGQSDGVIVKVELYGRRKPLTFAHNDRGVLVFRFRNPASVSSVL